MFPYYQTSPRSVNYPFTSPHVHFVEPAQPRSASPYHHNHHQYNEFPATDLEEEERAALAHLRSIHARREQIRLDAEREQQYAQYQRERQAARFVAEREAQAAARREVAQRDFLSRLIEEREREREQARREYARNVEAQRARQIAFEYEREQQRAAIEREVQRRRQHHQAVAAKVERRKAAAAIQRAKYEELAKGRAIQCAKHCAGKVAHYAKKQAAEHVKENRSDFEELNKVLGAMFGINLFAEAEEAEEAEEKPKAKEEKKVAEPVAVEKPKAVKPVEVKAAVPVCTVEKVKPAASEAPKEKKADNPAASFPDDINSILNQFLGLHVEPAGDKPVEGVSGGVPAGLNEFLGQFGLQFEPDTPAPAATQSSAPAESSNKAKSPTPAPTASKESNHTPLTAFLNERTNLPSFVRDILENVEIAFKESAQEKSETEALLEGKGKGVAAGERAANFSRPTPTPAPAEPAESVVSTASSIDTLNSISSELSLVLDSFTFPDALTFETTNTVPSEEQSTPTPDLPFNRRNRPYHTQANKLLQLLLAADSVSSGGDAEVRAKRKDVVRQVEAAIEALEKRRDQVWQGVKERREKGEDVEEDEDVASSAASAVDHEEHAARQEVEGSDAVKETEGDEVKHQHPAEEFELPEDEGENEVASSTEQTTAKPQEQTNGTAIFDSGINDEEEKEQEDKVTEETPLVVSDDKDKKTRVEEDKDEGYELV